jgi:hypothetical protein
MPGFDAGFDEISPEYWPGIEGLLSGGLSGSLAAWFVRAVIPNALRPVHSRASVSGNFGSLHVGRADSEEVCARVRDPTCVTAAGGSIVYWYLLKQKECASHSESDRRFLRMIRN